MRLGNVLIEGDCICVSGCVVGSILSTFDVRIQSKETKQNPIGSGGGYGSNDGRSGDDA